MHNDHIDFMKSVEGDTEQYVWASDYFTLIRLVKFITKGRITKHVHADTSGDKSGTVCLKWKPCLTQAEWIAGAKTFLEKEAWDEVREAGKDQIV